MWQEHRVEAKPFHFRGRKTPVGVLPLGSEQKALLPKTNTDSRGQFSCCGRRYRNTEKAPLPPQAQRHRVCLNLRQDQDDRDALLPPIMNLAPSDKRFHHEGSSKSRRGLSAAQVSRHC